MLSEGSPTNSSPRLGASSFSHIPMCPHLCLHPPPAPRCQVKEGGAGLLDGAQRRMGPSQGCTGGKQDWGQDFQGPAHVPTAMLLLKPSSYLGPEQQARVRYVAKKTAL